MHNTKHKDKIFELRAKGYSYKKITKELGCSNGNISYHLSPGGKDRSRIRRKNYRNKNPLMVKIESFNVVIKNKGRKIKQETVEKRFKDKVRKFHLGDFNMTVEDVMKKIGPNPICYLTGDPIDLSLSRSYQLDHIIPRSKGGTNSIDNLGICTRDSNLAKHDKTPEEFIEICKKVLLHNGYKVEKE